MKRITDEQLLMTTGYETARSSSGPGIFSLPAGPTFATYTVGTSYQSCCSERVRMEQLWAPWRLAYVAGAKPPTPTDPCFICQGLGEAEDRRNLIVLRTALSVVVLNPFPYNNGHLLVAPRAHKGRLDELTHQEILDTQQVLARM